MAHGSRAKNVHFTLLSRTSANTTNPINYLLDLFSRLFTKMNWQYTTTHEIDKIIKSLEAKKF
jgi:phenylalanyl-tRNA synthetase alpha subunit